MKNSSRDTCWAFFLALTAGVLYASFLSKAYVFEGLIRAMPIETGRWLHLLPGNYLLYGPLGLVFHTFLHLVGIQQPAVYSLQIMDALIGAFGVFIFYRTLRKLGGDIFASTVWTAGLAFSLGFWMWSTDAEDYILSTVLLMTAFFFLVKYVQGEKIDPVALGAVHGLAILGHIINVLFGAVVLWALITTHGKKWHKPAWRYLAAVAIVALGAYGMVVVFVRKPEHVHEVYRWFLGSAGSPDGQTSYFGGEWSAIKCWQWLKMSLHIWVSFSPAYTQPFPWPMSQSLIWAACFLLGIFAIAFFIRFDEIYAAHKAVVGGCLIWLGMYAIVFTRWQPWTMVYRVSDLVPMSVLLFLGFQSIPANRKIWRGAAAVLVVCLMIGNLGAEIYPRSFASNNANLERMAFLKANTAEGDWITGNGGLDEIYIPYFAERRPIVIERFAGQPERLASMIQALLAQNQNVFVTSRVRDSSEWKPFFDAYTLTLKATGPAGFALYQVGRYHGAHAHSKAISAA